jgi:hypothetical protein
MVKNTCSENLALVAVDPGKRYCGMALFVDGRLVAAGRPNPGELARGHDNAELAAMTGRAGVAWARRHSPGPFSVVAEHMVARGASFKTTSLLELCTVAGWICGAGETGRLVTVSEWKSNYKKSVVHGWIAKELTAEEEAVLGAAVAELNPRERGDVLDAVGIGLWALGRDVRRHKA